MKSASIRSAIKDRIGTILTAIADMEENISEEYDDFDAVRQNIEDIQRDIDFIDRWNCKLEESVNNENNS